jgi:hypothetical protein
VSSSTSISLAAAAALSLAACGAPSPPAAEPPPAAAGPATAAPSAAPAPKGASASGSPSHDGAASGPKPRAPSEPTARVLGVAVSDKSEHFTRITVSFENPTDKKCKIAGYTVTWSGGTKEISLDDFSLAPGQNQTRATRIHANDGDLTKLVSPESAQVTLRATCGNP